MAKTAPTSILLSWVDNTNNEQGFYIERSLDGGSTWAQIAKVGPDVEGYADTGLSRKTAYWCRVQAYNVVGPSGFSSTVSATTK